MAKIDVDKVLKEMDDHDKVSLLAGVDFWHTKSLPKYGIPALRLTDGPNGVRGTRFFNSVPAACFPCGTALGATFDQDLLYEAGELMAVEAKAKGAHVVLGPTINMQRSPLGGRGFESYSEDPVLAGLAAAAVIKGIQSQGIAATPKHFVCNDQEHERNRVNSIVTERALRELYLLPFQLAIRDGAPKALMTAYNKVNGIHASESKKLLADVLRGEWGWKGLVMSDWFGTYSTSEALNAGLDLEMPGPSHWRGPAAVLAASTYKLGPTTLDDRARSVLDLVNYAAGSGVPENAPEGGRDTPETAALLRRIAAESVVVLKNEGAILPLDKSKKTLVIGPNASIASYCGGGSASLNPYHAVTPLAAITEKVGGAANVVHTVGAYAHKDLPDLGPNLFNAADGKTAGVTFQVYNEPPETKAGDRKLLDRLQFETTNMMFMDYKNPAMAALWYADIDGYLVAEQSGDFEFGMCVYGGAQLLVDGKLVIDITDKQTQGTAFFGCGTTEEHGVVRVEKGTTYHVQIRFSSAPTSKLTPQAVSFGGGAVKIGGAWRIDASQEIARAAELAAQHEQVVLCLGLNKDWESEGFDRPDMRLPPGLDTLAAAVLKANPRTAVVVQSGTPVEMPWLPAAGALLQAWYGGNETGHGIADVVFGDVNPSAKLPLSFPAKVEHNPAYLHYRSEAGRVLYGEDVYMGYRYYDTVGVPVAFPFGHGLSYTTFALSQLAVAATADVLTATVTLANTGARAGAEVLQLYVRQHNPSVRRPAKELKGFQKTTVAAGATAEVAFSVPLKYAASFYDERRGQWVVEKDTYTVYVATSSELAEGTFVEATFEVPETFWWSGL